MRDTFLFIAIAVVTIIFFFVFLVATLLFSFVPHTIAEVSLGDGLLAMIQAGSLLAAKPTVYFSRGGTEFSVVTP